MLDQVQVEEFEPLVGTILRLSSGSDHVDLELTEARRLRSPSPRQSSPFALVLRHNGAKQSFGQGMYRLHHPTLGEMDLFVVPIGPDANGMCYEVTFN